MMVNEQQAILSYASVIAILVGGTILGMGIRCATYESETWTMRTQEVLSFSYIAFDIYRAFAVAGGTSVVIGIANLMLPFVSRDLLPVGINWPLELGVLFFLAMRLRYYRTRFVEHPW